MGTALSEYSEDEVQVVYDPYVNKEVNSRSSARPTVAVGRATAKTGEAESAVTQLVQYSSAKQQLTDYYMKDNPTKVSTVDDMLDKYKGKEGELSRKLELKYSEPIVLTNF